MPTTLWERAGIFFAPFAVKKLKRKGRKIMIRTVSTSTRGKTDF